MFEVGFSELVLIFGLALIVLGPQRLPKLAAQIGRWVGRARAMARQFREQLDQEVNLEETISRRATSVTPPPSPPTPPVTPLDPAADAQSPHERTGP